MARRSKIGPLPPVRRKRPSRRPPTKRPPRPAKPRLHIYSILAWGDAYHQQTGRWPTPYSGEVGEAPWETWQAIDTAMRHGYRGCRKGDSLVLLFHRYRGRPLPPPRPRPRLSVRKILAWADAHHRRTGRWPAQQTRGPVAAGRDESWRLVDGSLRKGLRGLPGGDSLARVLLRYRNVRRARYRPRLTIKQILAWADKHHARHGVWPNFWSGRVEGARGERWAAIHQALEHACRGLPPGYTLAKLLEKYRGVPYKRDLPRYTEPMILAWADAYHRRHGRWPTLRCGPIPEARGESWLKVEGALSKGRRGLPGRSSLAQLLERSGRHPRRNQRYHPARHTTLTTEQILAWADEFHRRNDRWPARLSGPIAGTRDETWFSVDTALYQGLRGLPRGLSVARLLKEQRGVFDKLHRPRLTKRAILAWADGYHGRTGHWPTIDSGLIPESSGDTWCAVNLALQKGLRGLPAGSSLAKLLEQQRGKRNLHHLPPLGVRTVLAWADAHYRRHTGWPAVKSGPIPESPGDTWAGVNAALHRGSRGLPAGLSLAKLLEQHRGKRNRRHLPPFRVPTILAWADAHQRRHGRWPRVKSGLIPESGDTWSAVENALRDGARGLPAGDTLFCFLERHGRGRPTRWS